jgi:hypothetical protein
MNLMQESGKARRNGRLGTPKKGFCVRRNSGDPVVGILSGIGMRSRTQK